MFANILKLLSANVIAQAIGIIVYPILTRLYSPDDFGVLNLFMSIGGICVIIATGELQYSIVLPKNEKTATACFHVGLAFSITFFVLTLFFIPFRCKISSTFGAEEISEWCIFLPLYIFISSLWNLMNSWYTRWKLYGKIATYQILQNSFAAGLKIVLGYFNTFFSGGLIFSSIIAPIISILINVKLTFRQCLKILFKVDIVECKRVLKDYSNFPKYSMPRAVINNFSGNLPFFILTPYFGLSELGFLGMAFTLAFRPINMITNSINHVFYQKVAELTQKNEDVYCVIKKYIYTTLIITIPAFTLLYFILPLLIDFLLGNKWHVTGIYIQYMLPWLIMVCLASVLNFIPDVYKKQRGLLIFEIIYIVVRLIALYCGILNNSFNISIILYFGVSAFILFLECIWFVYIVKTNNNENINIKK